MKPNTRNAMFAAAASLFVVAGLAPNGIAAEQVTRETWTNGDVSMDVWIAGASPPCTAETFCKTCIVETIVACANHGGSGSGMCEVTNDHCRCVFECRTSTLIHQLD